MFSPLLIACTLGVVVAFFSGFWVGRGVGRAMGRFEAHAEEVARLDAQWRRRTGRPSLKSIKNPAEPKGPPS